MTTRKKARQGYEKVEIRGKGGGAAAMYIALLDRIVQLAPSGVRVSVALHCEGTGMMMVGSCCDRCTSALFHMAAEAVPDPRTEDEPMRTNLH